MKRGDVVVAADASGGDFAGKPRPFVVIQSNLFSDTASVTLCPVTTDDIGVDVFRIGLAPSDANGLRAHCWIMVDKVTTVRRARISRVVGELSGADAGRLDLALLIFLGLAD